MPTAENLLGFSNRWYEEAIEHAEWVDFNETSIRVVSAPYFLATKLEAFQGRGKGDFLGSHDLEDMVAVVDGRPRIFDDMNTADTAVSDYVAETFRSRHDGPAVL